MKKFKFMIHPLFIVLSALLVYFGYFFLLLSYIITVILHEFAHSFVASKLGYKLNQINLMPHGASLSGDNRFFSARDEVLVAIAGPALNIILAILGCAVWWIFPSTYFYTQQFVYANVVTAVINFLPIFPLDGGRVLLAVMSRNGQRTKAIKKVRLIGIILSSVILVGFVMTVFFTPNYTMLIFGSFLFITSILEDKQEYYRPQNIPLYKLISAVTPDSITEFNVIDENYKVIGKISELQLEKLIQIYPASTTLKLILS